MLETPFLALKTALLTLEKGAFDAGKTPPEPPGRHQEPRQKHRQRHRQNVARTSPKRRPKHNKHHQKNHLKQRENPSENHQSHQTNHQIHQKITRSFRSRPAYSRHQSAATCCLGHLTRQPLPSERSLAVPRRAQGRTPRGPGRGEGPGRPSGEPSRARLARPGSSQEIAGRF